MWPFSKRLAVSATIPPAAVIDRDAELLTQLRDVQRELHKFDAEALAFKSRHQLQFDILGQIVKMKCALPMSEHEHQSVRADWQALQNRIAPRLKLFHATLREISERKQAREKTNLEAA